MPRSLSIILLGLPLLLSACAFDADSMTPTAALSPAPQAPVSAGVQPPYPGFVPPPPAQPPLPQPSPPVPITTCDPGGCWNGNGERYHGGSGNSFVGPGGRLCQRHGAWMRCF